MADTNELYRGVINEFVDWVTGIDSKTQEHVDTELRQIAGGAIRELLQRRLLQPIYNYNNPNVNKQMVFPSKYIADLWEADGRVDSTNPYSNYILVELPKPNTYKFQFDAKIKTSDGKYIPVDNGKTYYILKSGSSIGLDVMYSFRTVEAENDTEWYNENATVSIYIQDPNGITKSFTRSRTYTAITDYHTDAIGSYLKSGTNTVLIKMTGEGNKGAGVAASGLKDKTVIQFTVNIVEMELSVLFDDSPTKERFNINRAIQPSDDNITSNTPSLMINYELKKTIIGEDNYVYFDIFIDADVLPNHSALLVNDESYHIQDAQATEHIVVKDGNSPTFTIATNNNDASFTITKDTPGIGDAAAFLANLRNSGFAGQHSFQMYAYIYIGEEVFRSNTVYFTFNVASSLNSNLYANIYYNGNKYPKPYFTNANQRYILCNQYEDVNISWAIYSPNPNNREIEWDLEYPGHEGYNQKLTTQTVAPYSTGTTGSLLQGTKGIQFVPIYTNTAYLVAYCNEHLSDVEVSKKQVFKIEVRTTAASFQIQEKGGYIFKLSAYSKSNGTDDQDQWIPVNSSGSVPAISTTHANEPAYTEFHNVNFNSESTGWVNHGLNIYGLNSYATIYYNALEMTGLLSTGHTIEIEFETMRVQSDFDVLLKIGNDSGGSIVITPTKAYIASNGTPTAALTNYKINERMRLAFIFNKFNPSVTTFNPEYPDNNLMFIINNGILERAASMSGSETNYKSGQGYIKIGNEPGDMQIPNNEGVINVGRGSGIIVYNIKIYATALTYNEALHNYILDAVNKSDIINRNRSLDMITQKLTYNECCSYVPTFLISGDLRLILNKNADGSKAGKEESESNVDITYVNPYDPTRNFSVEGCQIRKHGQSTLTYPITSMKFWLNKKHGSDEIPKFTWDYQNNEVNTPDQLVKNRYIMKKNSFVDDANLFSDLSGKTSIPANKFVLQANFADSSGVHNGAIERLIQLTWMKAIINNVYVLRTPPQLFTTNVLNLHDYKHEIIEYELIEQGGEIISVPHVVEVIDIETYTIDQAYGPNSFWHIFTGPPQGVSAETWNTAYAKIKDLPAKNLINLSATDYNTFSEAQQDIIDAELCYQGYGKLHSTHARYTEFNIQPGHVAGHIMWNDFFPPEDNKTKPFPYYIGVAADSLPCAVFYQSTIGEENEMQFLGQYVLMEDKKSEQCFGEGSIYAGVGGKDYNDPFCFKAKSQKNANNGKKQNAKQYRLWNNKRVLRIEVLNIDTMFTSFLSKTEQAIPATQLNSEELSACEFDDIIRTPKDDQGNYTINMAWENDFELIYPDPDDVAEDQIKANEDRIKEGLAPIYNYYEAGSEFRKITQPWVDFFEWATDTTGDQAEFQATAAMHLDLWKMAAYYIYYLRFGLVDSVERNAQWKTYDGLHWHCEPWDMDIALGNNNQGQITYNPPMTRKTKLGQDSYAYSGSALKYGNLQGNWIWNALEAWSDWKDDILPKVAKALTEAGLTYDNINYMFDKEYVYKWSESIYNIGGHFKYIESGDMSKLGWLQGSRETHRHWWLYESMNYYDSLWKCGDYINKNIEIYTNKIQGEVGYADITTNRDCLIMVVQNRIATVVQLQAKQNVATGTAVSFTNLSLSTKVPLEIYGSMFFEKLDISTISAQCARLGLGGAYSTISGGTLYELNIGTPSQRNSPNKYTFAKIGSNKFGIENGHFEHLHTYNIEGQTGLTYDAAQLTFMPALENLYAKGSGLEIATFNELQFKKLELPASTPKLVGGVQAGTTILTNVSFNNVTWEDISFWTGTYQAGTSTLVCNRYGQTSFPIGNEMIYGTIPSTISNISFSGNTAKTPRSKDFIYKWEWLKYYEATNGSSSSNNEEQLINAFKNCILNLQNIDWEIETGFVAEYNNENPDAILLMSYWDLKLLSYIPKDKRVLTGYIVIGNASENIGETLYGSNNKLTSTQMENLQNWFGDNIYSSNAALQISHINSYVSLSIITDPNKNGSSYKIDNHVYLKESELGDNGQIIINATKFGVRNDNTVFDWKVMYYNNEGDDLISTTGANPTIAGNKSINITYYNAYRNQIFIYARESYINTLTDTLGEHIYSYPIILKCYPHGQEETESTTIDFTVLPKIWPDNVRITVTESNNQNVVTMYPGMGILGIRDNIIMTIDTQGHFTDFTEEWYSILADGDATIGNNNNKRVKYAFADLKTTGTATTQGVITFYLLTYNITDVDGGDTKTIDNKTKEQVTYTTVPFNNTINKPEIKYLINSQGQVVLNISNLQETVYDYNVAVYLTYEKTGSPSVNQIPTKLAMADLKIRTLNDKEVILNPSQTNTYACIANALTVPLQATPSGALFKMDLFLLEGTLDFSKTQYRRNLQSTLSDRYAETTEDSFTSIFLYLPSIKNINLNSCVVPSRQNIQGIYKNSFDFTNCTKLEALNMSQMQNLDNTISIDLSNCTKLKSVISNDSNVTFKYPKNIASLSTITLGNPLYIILKNLPGLTTLNETTGNDCEHLDMETLKNGSTFAYFAKLYKKLRK